MKKKILLGTFIFIVVGLSTFGIVQYLIKANKNLELKYLGVYTQRESIMLSVKNDSNKNIVLNASDICFNYNGKVYTGDYITQKNANVSVFDVDINSGYSGKIIIIFKNLPLINLDEQTFYYKDLKISILSE